jgi:hypothetical protein
MGGLDDRAMVGEREGVCAISWIIQEGEWGRWALLA